MYLFLIFYCKSREKLVTEEDHLQVGISIRSQILWQGSTTHLCHSVFHWSKFGIPIRGWIFLHSLVCCFEHVLDRTSNYKLQIFLCNFVLRSAWVLQGIFSNLADRPIERCCWNTVIIQKATDSKMTWLHHSLLSCATV